MKAVPILQIWISTGAAHSARVYATKDEADAHARANAGQHVFPAEVSREVLEELVRQMAATK